MTEEASAGPAGKSRTPRTSASAGVPAWQAAAFSTVGGVGASAAPPCFAGAGIDAGVCARAGAGFAAAAAVGVAVAPGAGSGWGRNHHQPVAWLCPPPCPAAPHSTSAAVTGFSPAAAVVVGAAAAAADADADAAAVGARSRPAPPPSASSRDSPESESISEGGQECPATRTAGHTKLPPHPPPAPPRAALSIRPAPKA